MVAFCDREQELLYDLERSKAEKDAKLTQATIRAWNAARKALDEYRSEQSARESSGNNLLNPAEIAGWLTIQGWSGKHGGPVSARTVGWHIEQGVLARGKNGFSRKTVLDYARSNLTPPATVPESDSVDHAARLKKALADERELKVAQMKASLLDAAEEEARDAAVILGIKRHLEVTAPERAKQLLAGISEILTDEQRGALTARLPEIIAHDHAVIADIFDRLSVQGCIHHAA